MLAAALVLLALAMAACSSGERGDDAPPADGQQTSDGPLSPPAQPLRPEDVPFRFVGPLDAKDALSIERLDTTWFFVLDLLDRTIYPLESSPSTIERQSPSPRSIRWVDDETLLIETREQYVDGGIQKLRPGPNYRLRLDGTVALGQRDPLEKIDWLDGVASPDGEWTATLIGAPWDDTPEGSFQILMAGRPQEDPSFRIITGSGSSTWWLPAWAPDGHLLAFTGNICRGYDLFVFDPAQAELRNLTSALEDQALRFAWHPNGSSLAASVHRIYPQPSRIDLIDLATSSTTTLLESTEIGLLQPIAWNPSGSHLTFDIFQGGWCEGVGFDFPVPPPTALEILRD